jgi:predicted nucleic acid-binding protein
LKQKKAQAWMNVVIESDVLVLSAQSLREYYAVALRRDRSSAAVAELRDEIAALAAFVPDALREDRLADAWALQDRHRISFWDGLMLASALAHGCAIFLSEDMNAGQKIETLRIVDPFKTAPEDVLA